jgi:hypothetical protein
VATNVCRLLDCAICRKAVIALDTYASSRRMKTVWTSEYSGASSWTDMIPSRQAAATIAFESNVTPIPAVADTVLKAASAKHPKIRYAAGKLANRLRLLRRFAPAGLVDAGIRKDLRLDALPAAQPARTARAF